MANRRRILIVEDDETLRTILAEHLEETQEFTVASVESLEAADRLLADEDSHFDALFSTSDCRTATAATIAHGCGARDTACRSSC